MWRRPERSAHTSLCSSGNFSILATILLHLGFNTFNPLSFSHGLVYLSEISISAGSHKSFFLIAPQSGLNISLVFFSKFPHGHRSNLLGYARDLTLLVDGEILEMVGEE